MRTDTIPADSKAPSQKRVFAIHIYTTGLKGVSSLNLHRDLKATQETAWSMPHRIREAMREYGGLMPGPVEVDETYWGGMVASMRRASIRRASMSGSMHTQMAGIVPDHVRQRVCRNVPSHGGRRLQRHGNEFAGRQGRRELNTETQMCLLVAAIIGKRLLYKQLNGRK